MDARIKSGRDEVFSRLPKGTRNLTAGWAS